MLVRLFWKALPKSVLSLSEKIVPACKGISAEHTICPAGIIRMREFTMRNTMMKLAAAVALTFAAPLAKAETLADALVSAYNNSGLLEQNRAVLRAADEDVAQAMSSLRPVINWSASAGAQGALDNLQRKTTTVGLTGSWTLFDFGAREIGVNVQKETVLSTRQVLVNVEQQVLLGAVQSYLDVVTAREFVALREANIRVLTQEFRAAKDRFEVGEITKTDVALSEARLASARSLLAVAQGDLARAIEGFRVAIGRDPSAPSAVNPAAVTYSLAEAKAFAVRNHPSIIQAQHAVTAAELAVKRAEAGTRPTLSVSGSVGFAESKGTWGTAADVGISAGGPVYNGGRSASVIRQAMARRDSARAQLHLATLSVEQAVGNAYANYSVARAASEAYQRSIEAQESAYDGVKEEARLGSRTTLEVLNAEQELLDTRANALDARANEVLASYAILQAMGLLTAENLKLNVQTYDPASYYDLVKNAPSGFSEQGRALDRVLEALGK